MKNLKTILATVTLMAVLTFGPTVASAGIIITNRDGGLRDTTKTEQCKNSSEKIDYGIIITNIVGIIITNFTGIIITNVADAQVDCGIGK